MNKIVHKSSFSLLNADYVQLNKSWNYKHIISPFYRLYLIEDGAGTLINSTDSVHLESGFLYLIPSFTLCNYHCENHLSQYYLQFLEESDDGTSLFASNRKIFKVPANVMDLAIFKRILYLNPGRGLSKNDPKDYEKRPVLQGFQDLNNALPISVYMETNGIILQLLSRFLTEEYFKQDNKKAIPSKVLEAIHYIQTNLHLPLTVESLAERADQNPDYFSRIFKEHTGERPLAFIQYKRIERAQFLMIRSDMTLQGIAAETGFESLSYFSRIFKSFTSQTPGEYKKNNSSI